MLFWNSRASLAACILCLAYGTLATPTARRGHTVIRDGFISTYEKSPDGIQTERGGYMKKRLCDNGDTTSDSDVDTTVLCSRDSCGKACSADLVQRSAHPINEKDLNIRAPPDRTTQPPHVSRRGAWASHIWGDPTFTGDKKDFQKYAIDEMKTGHGEGTIHAQGILNFRSDGEPKNGLGDMFDDDAEPRVFIMTPRPNPRLDDDSIDVTQETNQGQLKYPTEVGKMKDALNSMFGDDDRVHIQVIDYSPLLAPKSMGWKAAESFRNDDDFNSPRWKVLVQFQPAEDDYGEASWRIWFEGKSPDDDISMIRGSLSRHMSRSWRHRWLEGDGKHQQSVNAMYIVATYRTIRHNPCGQHS
ncbi:Uu.00g085210.m01.CDS01 [Anthostomella pinea]|uniref:Uu.00g085210.m01.CDS01 n=1 Tax=Anthostomella pinea TaxID=933095 RepID=A0AAI8YJS2_9PEZI|nr:Uu.00g085210.m01.CDS01 [Anthostomella pinea]